MSNKPPLIALPGNVVPFRIGSVPLDQPTEAEKTLQARHNTSRAEMRSMVKPLFLWMHFHAIKEVRIEANGTVAMITIDGERV